MVGGWVKMLCVLLEDMMCILETRSLQSVIRTYGTYDIRMRYVWVFMVRIQICMCMYGVRYLLRACR